MSQFAREKEVNVNVGRKSKGRKEGDKHCLTTIFVGREYEEHLTKRISSKATSIKTREKMANKMARDYTKDKGKIFSQNLSWRSNCLYN